jgi:hypothetical protein
MPELNSASVALINDLLLDWSEIRSYCSLTSELMNVRAVLKAAWVACGCTHFLFPKTPNSVVRHSVK